MADESHESEEHFFEEAQQLSSPLLSEWRMRSLLHAVAAVRGWLAGEIQVKLMEVNDLMTVF